MWSVNEFKSSFPAKIPTFLIPAFTKFESEKSIILYVPPAGTEASGLILVSALILSNVSSKNIIAI